MELILTNKNGEILDLLNNDSYFILSGCDALHGVETEIQDVSSPYLDGTIVEGVKALPRGISLTFTLIPDIKKSIDFFTSVVKSKQWVTLTETENDRTITIKGIATIPPYTRMEAMCKIQLDIYCNQPYWEDAQEIINTISAILPRLFFPFDTGQYFTRVDGYQGGRVFSVFDTSAEKTFINDGDVAVGMNIRIVALGEIENPCIACSSGEQDGWLMYLNLTLQQNDEVEINTTRGNKFIKINGSTTYEGKAILSYFYFEGYDWLQLETGNNTFNVGSYDEITKEIIATNNVYFNITYKRKWE